MRILRLLGGAALLLAAAPGVAQQAGLRVSVTEAGGGPVAGAAVTLTNPDSGAVRRAVTDARGQVQLSTLPTGRWQVAVAAGDGHGGAQAEVELRATFTRAVTLEVAAEAATILVTAPAVTGLNAVNAEISASIGARELRALPVEGRDLAAALVRLPNVVPSTGFFPEAPVISVNGANGLFTSYLLDGLDNNENFLGGPKFPVPLGFVREASVLAGSWPAAYGRSTTGIVNVTTPAGGNRHEGEIYALWRPGSPPDASSAFPRRDLSGNAVGESFSRWQTGVVARGPLLRDRTFYSLNLELTFDRNEQLVDAPALGVVAPVVGRNRFLLGSARIDHRLADDWDLVLRANVGRVTIERPGGGLGGGNVTFPSAGSDQDRDSTLVAASVAHAGDDWSYDGAVQFSRFRWDYGEPRQGPGPQVAIEGPDGLTAGVVGHPGYVFDSLETSWQTRHRLQRRMGAHRLSGGIDLLISDFSLAGGGNPQGNFRVALDAGQLAALSGQELALTAADVLALDPAVLSYGVELRPSRFGRGQTQIGLSIEDEWQISAALTATLGLRYDFDSLTAAGAGDGDRDNVAPRLALNWRPQPGLVLRGGAGLFHGRLPYAVISDALQRNRTGAAFTGQLAALQAQGRIPAGVALGALQFDGNLVVSPACTKVSECPAGDAVAGLADTLLVNEARILSPTGYRSPESFQLSGGVEWQPGPGVTLGADLLWSRTRNLVRLRDLNAPAPFTPDASALTPATIAMLRALPDNAARVAMASSLGLVRTPAAADLTRPVAPVAGGARQIMVSETAGTSVYKALNLQLVKAPGEDFWGLRLSYTLSSLENDSDDINFRASDANDFDADWGPSANDRRHVLSMVGMLLPADGVTLTLAGLFQSGQPVNYVPDAGVFGTQDLNGDGQSFGENYVGNSDRWPGEGRNSGRLPWSATLDFGARWLVPLGGAGVELSADVFNLLNRSNLSGFANAATTSNQVQLGGGAARVQRNAGAPRQFQFGVAVRW